MMTDITLPNLTLLLFVIVFGLGVALVWLLCELERRFAPQSAAVTGMARRQRSPDLDAPS